VGIDNECRVESRWHPHDHTDETTYTWAAVSCVLIIFFCVFACLIAHETTRCARPKRLIVSELRPLNRPRLLEARRTSLKNDAAKSSNSKCINIPSNVHTSLTVICIRHAALIDLSTVDVGSVCMRVRLPEQMDTVDV